ncbi:neuroendocrine convertase 2-like protein, partial [Dinothrombium tinctorium]
FQILKSPNEFHFVHRALPHARTKRSISRTRLLKSDPNVEFAVQQNGFKRVKRGFKQLKLGTEHLLLNKEPADPYFPFQWYLVSLAIHLPNQKRFFNINIFDYVFIPFLYHLRFTFALFINDYFKLFYDEYKKTK